jgi:hypothetical protein
MSEQPAVAPLARCEHCGGATDGPLAACERPECARADAERDRLFIDRDHYYVESGYNQDAIEGKAQA